MNNNEYEMLRLPTGLVPYALVVAHANGTVHVRTTTGWRYGQAMAVFHDASRNHHLGVDIDFAVDLSCSEDGPGLFVQGLRPWIGQDYEAGDAGRIARLLADAGWFVFAYEAFYAGDVEGPVVQYRRSLGVRPDQPLRLVFNTDYGFDDGSWYFAEPATLKRVLEMATELGVRAYVVDGREGVEAVAFDAEAPGWRQVNKALEGAGLTVHREEFRPSDFYDGPEGD